jgi:hypothetical protein
MYNTVAESNADTDLGSGGAVLLPDMTDVNGVTRHLVVGAGKDGHIYIVDRDNMGKFNSVSNANIYQDVPGATASGEWGTPAYFKNTLYIGGRGDNLKAFKFSNAKLATTPASISSVTFIYPGTTPSISANGTSDGIVWVEQIALGADILLAYDAADLTTELIALRRRITGINLKPLTSLPFRQLPTAKCTLVPPAESVFLVYSIPRPQRQRRPPLRHPRQLRECSRESEPDGHCCHYRNYSPIIVSET